MTGASRDLAAHVPRIVLGWHGAEEGSLHRAAEGTMAFVDISGFTAMSERLARRGKEGAEEVVEIINAIFGRLLAVAYENGGSLLKFGGDALLLFFDGAEHEARACHAAAWMRRRLRELVPVRTSAGEARLKMHVGIHSGTFDVFVVGDLHRELVIAGPAATTTVAMESAAEAGEIVVSDATAARIPGRLIAAGPDGGRRLIRTPAPSLVHVDTSAPVRVDPARFLARAIREYASVRADPEHRTVAVAFVRFDGADELIRHDPPAAARTLDALVRTVQGAADQNAVTFISSDPERDGGKFMLVAGAPRSTERDEEALLRTLRQVVETAGDVRVRAGVNRGRVFSGLVGPSYRQNFTVMGDAVNLAARLMGKAEPGQVIATPEVVEGCPELAELTELPPFSVKGKGGPIVAFDVGPLTGRGGTGVSGRAPLAGRERELATLSAAMETAAAGRGRVVQVSAEPGMGKSRLVDELRWRAAGHRLIEATAEQYTASVPYVLVDALVRQALGMDASTRGREAGAALASSVHRVAPQLEPWLPLVAIAIGAEVDRTPEAAKLDEAFVTPTLHRTLDELLAAALPSPTLIVVEDLHWADEASRAFLEHLVSSVHRRPWLACVTTRPGARSLLVEGVTGEEIELAPLDEDDALAMARSLGSAAEIGPDQVAALVERAGGNPLFLQELVVGTAVDPVAGELPRTVEAVIGTRIDALPPDRRALLRRAAVLGMTFDADLLRELVASERTIGWDDLSVDTVRGALSGFVVADDAGRCRFEHALIRDVAYEGLPFRLRRVLHRTTGEILEQRASAPLEVAEVLSLHFELAGVTEKAWSYAVLAGDHARERFASLQAIEFYGRALGSARRLPDVPILERARISESLGDMCERAGRYDDAARAYSTARGWVDATSVAFPRLCLKQGVVRLRMGRYPEALRWYRRGLATPSRDRDAAPVRVELMLSYAGARYYQGRYRDCIEWCERALPEAERASDTAGLAHAYSLLHLAHTHLGSAERAKYRGLALPLYEELGDRTRQGHVLNNMGIDAYYEGDWERAIDLYERGRRALEEAGGIVDAADVTYNVGEILCDQGRLDEAEAITSEILATYRAARYPVGEALATANLGRIASRAGRFTEAVDLLEDARRRFAELGDERFSVEVDCHVVELCTLMAAPDEVLSRIRPLLERIRRLGDVPALRARVLRALAFGLAQAGDRPAAVREVRGSIDTARPAHLTYELALSLEALSRLLRDEDPVAASDAEAEAKEILTSLGVVATPDVPLG